MSTSSASEPLSRTEPRWSELEKVTPLRLASAADAIDGLTPLRIAAPENDEQVSSLLTWANENGVRVIARGGGSKLGCGNRPGAVDLVLSLEKFNHVIEHAWQDMTVTVQAGTIIATLQAELAKQKQHLPLDALWPERSTVGGVIATNDSGALRMRFGSVRDLILGVTVVLANGTIARSGGRVVKNVAGYDLPKLFTGSMGTLGVITEVTLRAYPLPHATRTISFKFADVAAANRYMLAISNTTLVPASLQLRVSGDAAVVDLRFEGLEAGIAVQVQRATELASEGESTDSHEDVWTSREKLFDGEPASVVGKFSVLPSAIAVCVKTIQSHASNFQVVAQSLGLGMFRTTATDISALRGAIAKLGGTVTILQAPLELKKSIDVFGETGSALPLMVRIKQRFDPQGTLSPGRFVGGI